MRVSTGKYKRKTKAIKTSLSAPINSQLAVSLNNQVLHQSEQAFAFQKCLSARAPCYAVWNRQLRTVSALRPWLTDNTGVCAQAGSNFSGVHVYYLFVPATTKLRELNLSPLTMNVASSIPSCMSNCMIRPSDFTTETLRKSLS